MGNQVSAPRVSDSWDELAGDQMDFITTTIKAIHELAKAPATVEELQQALGFMANAMRAIGLEFAIRGIELCPDAPTQEETTNEVSNAVDPDWTHPVVHAEDEAAPDVRAFDVVG